MKLPKVELSRWDFRLIGVDWSEDDRSDHVVLRVHAEAPDVATGEVGAIVTSERFHCQEIALAREHAYQGSFIKAAIMRALAHELDECLYIDGKRVCADPHPKKERP